VVDQISALSNKHLGLRSDYLIYSFFFPSPKIFVGEEQIVSNKYEITSNDAKIQLKSEQRIMKSQELYGTSTALMDLYLEQI
jgi:hypothetical protein